MNEIMGIEILGEIEITKGAGKVLYKINFN